MTEKEEEKVVDGAVGLKKSIGCVIHNPDICAGCRTCEIVCALNEEGVASSQLSRLQISRDIYGGTIDVMPCKQCDEPECLLACPTGALHIDETTGARVIDEKECDGCQLCLDTCQFVPPRIRFNAKKIICFKCYLCGGDPQCVKFCPTGALTASWLKEEEEKEEEQGTPMEVEINGDAITWTHIMDLTLTETSTGLLVKGTLWTSHCTRGSILYANFKLQAEFYDAAGMLLGTSNEVKLRLPEIKSQDFKLDFATFKKLADVTKGILTVDTEEVRAY